MFDEMSTPLEKTFIRKLKPSHYLRPHLILFTVLMMVLMFANYVGPLPFDVKDVMVIWGIALLSHVLYAFLNSGAYEPRREEMIEKMMYQDPTLASSNMPDKAVMMKVLDYDIRKATKPLQSVLRAGSISGFATLLLWLVTDVTQGRILGGFDYIAFMRLPYALLLVAVAFYYRNELLFDLIQDQFSHLKGSGKRKNEIPQAHKPKHTLEVGYNDDYVETEYELRDEETIKRRLRE